jgi:hypothetical protein
VIIDDLLYLSYMEDKLENITNLQNRIVDLNDFITQLEKDIFDYEKVKDRAPEFKTEYFKLAVSTFLSHVKTLKELKETKVDPQVEMINILLDSMTDEEKKELVDFLIRMARKKKLLNNKKNLLALEG